MIGKIKIAMLKGEKGDTGATGDYAGIDNKPQINGVELDGNKSASDLGLATAEEQQNLLESVNMLNTTVGGIDDDITAINGDIDDIKDDITAINGNTTTIQGGFSFASGVNGPVNVKQFGSIVYINGMFMLTNAPSSGAVILGTITNVDLPSSAKAFPCVSSAGSEFTHNAAYGTIDTNGNITAHVGTDYDIVIYIDAFYIV